MSQDYTAEDLRRNVTVYRQEAERSRKWAAICRQDAANQDQLAAQFDRRADEFEAMLPGLTERSERTERRHAKADATA